MDPKIPEEEEGEGEEGFSLEPKSSEVNVNEEEEEEEAFFFLPSIDLVALKTTLSAIIRICICVKYGERYVCIGLYEG